MKVFCQRLGNLDLGMYFCTAKKETLRIVPQQALATLLDTVLLTYPMSTCMEAVFYSI